MSKFAALATKSNTREFTPNSKLNMLFQLTGYPNVTQPNTPEDPHIMTGINLQTGEEIEVQLEPRTASTSAKRAEVVDFYGDRALGMKIDKMKCPVNSVLNLDGCRPVAGKPGRYTTVWPTVATKDPEDPVLAGIQARIFMLKARSGIDYLKVEVVDSQSSTKVETAAEFLDVVRNQLTEPEIMGGAESDQGVLIRAFDKDMEVIGTFVRRVPYVEGEAAPIANTVEAIRAEEGFLEAIDEVYADGGSVEVTPITTFMCGTKSVEHGRKIAKPELYSRVNDAEGNAIHTRHGYVITGFQLSNIVLKKLPAAEGGLIVTSFHPVKLGQVVPETHVNTAGAPKIAETYVPEPAEAIVRQANDAPQSAGVSAALEERLKAEPDPEPAPAPEATPAMPPPQAQRGRMAPRARPGM